MANMVLEPIIEKLISAGLRYVKDQVTRNKRTKEELEKLQENLPKIQAVVHFASSQEQITDQNRALNKWLWQIRDAIDDADDVVDELEYMELEKQVNKNKKLRRVRSIMKSMKKRFIKIGKRALKIDPTLKRLKEVVKKLYKVSTTGVDTFLHLVQYAKQELLKQQLELHAARETGSLPKNDLIGRGKDKEIVMEWLRNPSIEHWRNDFYKNISLLSIVGHGGMGKTTLLQHVYKDEITKEFDLKIWVCVSNNFDVKKVIAYMLQSVTMMTHPFDTLEALQEPLKAVVMAKKFLLVLDDVWEEEEERDKSKWENVLAPLTYGGFGSKILVTTRTNSVALMFAGVIKKKTKIIKLESLEEDECLQLLNSHAFAGVENPSDDHKKLRALAGEIVRKLLRSPLAAKVIGSVLYSLDLDERRWREVLESNLLARNSINSILTLSYIVLPNHLRNCFAICCMFPHDHRYDQDDLVRMWIALGFIQPFQEMTMEDIGGRYFDVLVKNALFDKVGDDYKMHDLIHESASTFFAHECGRIVDDHENASLKISDNIRHLFVRTTKPDMLKKIKKFKHLHSLFLFYEGFDEHIYSSLIQTFKALTSLRLLYISTYELKMIPEEIGNLTHLRYLNIKLNLTSTRLPRSLSNLYHLQYLFYDPWVLRHLGVAHLLSSDINNLSNLRCMKLPMNIMPSICGVGKLKSLQELDGFFLRDESGYRIGELKYLNDLCKLEILGLENVRDAEEARDAQLYEKNRLIDLTLDWSSSNSRNINLDENVLDNLHPPKCLRNLIIRNYMGARSAIWMKDVNSISNLEKIELSGCNYWETLLPFGQLCFLKSLFLHSMSKVKWLESKFNGNDKYDVFPLLEKLHIKELKALEDLFEAGVAAEDGCLFPCLIELSIENCTKLKKLPSLPPKLKILNIANMMWKSLNFCGVSSSVPLETLRVVDCPNITSLHLADEMASLAALRNLTINKCPNLRSLGNYPEVGTSNIFHLMLSNLSITDPSVLLMEPLRSIVSLKTLAIALNDEVVSFPNEAEQWFLKVGYSVSELRFSSLKSLQSLPSTLESLYSLQKLSIVDLPMLRELPNLPPSLKSLEIYFCHPVLKDRYGEDGGSDRYKIAGIPHIDIRP